MTGDLEPPLRLWPMPGGRWVRKGETMRKMICGMAAVATLLAAGVVRAEPTDAEAAKSTALAFVQAIAGGDAAKALSMAEANESQRAAVNSMAKMILSLRKLSDAATSKYHEAGKVLQMSNPTERIAKEVADGNVLVDPAQKVATFTRVAGTDDQEPLRLVLKEGRWKVDLNSMADADQAPRMTAIFDSVAKVASDTADEINADKYHAVEDAERALDTRLEAAFKPISSGGAPSTQSTTAP